MLRDIIFCILCFSFLCVVFSTGSGAPLVEESWFKSHQAGSDDLVFRAFTSSLPAGSTPGVGLRLVEQEICLGAFTPLSTYQKFHNSVQLTSRGTLYPSQAGIQTLLLLPAYWYSFLSSSPDIGEKLYRGSKIAIAIVVVLNALAITLFILWAKREFSIQVAIAFTISLPIVAPWLVVFGHSVYWMLWSWFLPFLIALYGWRRMTERGGSVQLRVLYGALFCSFVLKMLMGYEYISTIAIAASSPVVFYGVCKNWGIKQMLLRILATGTTSLFAFAIALLIHLQFLQAEMKGSLPQAMDMILSRFFVRAWGNIIPAGRPIPDQYANSLSSSVFHVLKTYLLGGGEWVIILLMLIAILYYRLFSCRFTTNTGCVKSKALIITSAYSILAPLSHFILMKGHSYIHTHMNYVLWWLPFNAFCLIFIVLSLLCPYSITIKDQ